MRNIYLTLAILAFFDLQSNTLFEFKPVDCWAFADAVEGQAGDSGDFEVWADAFEHCSKEQGFETVVISN